MVPTGGEPVAVWMSPASSTSLPALKWQKRRIAWSMRFRRATVQEESSECLGKRFHMCGGTAGCFQIPGRELFDPYVRL